MKKGLLIVLLLVLGFQIKAQKIHGSIKAKLRPDVKMNLAKMEGSTLIDITSTQIKPSGIFDFGNVNQPKGLYVLYTTQKGRNFEFIISNESEVKVKILDSGFKGIEVENSAENKLYSIYKKDLNTKNRKVNKLKKTLKKPGITLEEKKKIQNQINVLEKAFFVQTNDQINTLPNSFFSDLILAENADNKTDQSKYFDDLDFKNESFIRSRVFSSRFREYVVLFSKGEKYRFMDCIDDIMEKAKVNKKVYEFAANELMTGFFNSGLEEMSTYILNEYIFAEDCSELELSDVLKRKGQEIKNLQIGNYPGNISLKNAINKTEDLSKVVSENKYTLIMFWSSTCHSCEAQIPLAKEIYTEYASKSFEIYGVSLDIHKTGWVKAISENRMNWINVCDFEGWDSPVGDLYRIVKTPTYFLLDNKGKLVGKPRHISEVQQMLAKLL